MYESFSNNDFEHFASLTNEYWHFKRESRKKVLLKKPILFTTIFSTKIIGGGKIVGAGGGGFLLVIIKDRTVHKILQKII